MYHPFPRLRIVVALVAGFFGASAVPSLSAKVTAAALFSDHAVLQQGRPIPVWGWAEEGETIKVALDESVVSTVAKNGRWQVTLPAQQAGGPHVMRIEGSNTLIFRDILVGEVWICSGQSNMERVLGPRTGMLPITDWEKEASSANLPSLRCFTVPRGLAFTPSETVKGDWVVCDPKTVLDFSAVGFFFARAVLEARHVPVGLIHSSWGGTRVEPWTSRPAIERMAGFGEALRHLDELRADPVSATRQHLKDYESWFEKRDAGSAAGASWNRLALKTDDWRLMTLPSFWEKAGLPDFDGIVWFRKTVHLPASWEGVAAQLELGPIDDSDVTWMNETRVGGMSEWWAARRYPVPEGVLHAGENVVAVRVLDGNSNGGIWGDGKPMRLVNSKTGESLPLDGEWSYKIGATKNEAHWEPPVDPLKDNSRPTAIYNAMIAPLQPFAIRGVIWYQGESNAGEARAYRDLFPNLIADWRERWKQGGFPFLFVQIAPWRGMGPEIREAQLLTLKQSPNTAMAVTIDVGNAEDIHPAEKRPIGERLALAARALAYGEKIEYSGPNYVGMKRVGPRVILTFDHVGKGLVAKGTGELVGFIAAGADKVFKPAKARIVKDTVEVTADGVAEPVAVRYAWANVPVGNLFNADGLPASPFRTDVD